MEAKTFVKMMRTNKFIYSVCQSQPNFSIPLDVAVLIFNGFQDIQLRIKSWASLAVPFAFREISPIRLFAERFTIVRITFSLILFQQMRQPDTLFQEEIQFIQFHKISVKILQIRYIGNCYVPITDLRLVCNLSFGQGPSLRKICSGPS